MCFAFLNVCSNYGNHCFSRSPGTALDRAPVTGKTLLELGQRLRADWHDLAVSAGDRSISPPALDHPDLSPPVPEMKDADHLDPKKLCVDLLLMVVTEVEFFAVMRKLKPLPGHEAVCTIIPRSLSWRIQNHRQRRRFSSVSVAWPTTPLRSWLDFSWS
jgi:hypothetical protein